MTNNVKASTTATSSVQRATASQCGAIASRFSCLPNLEPIAREAWAAKKDADPQVCMNGKLYALIKDFFESWAKADDETAALTNSLVQQFLGSAEGQMNQIVSLDEIVPGLHQYFIEEAAKNNIDMSSAAYVKQDRYATKADARPVTEVLASFLATLKG